MRRGASIGWCELYMATKTMNADVHSSIFSICFGRSDNAGFEFCSLVIKILNLSATWWLAIRNPRSMNWFPQILSLIFSGTEKPNGVEDDKLGKGWRGWDWHWPWLSPNNISSAPTKLSACVGGQLVDATGTLVDATTVLLIELLSGAEFPLGSLATLPRLFWSAWAMSIASEMVESSECCTSIGARCSLPGITGSSGTSTTLGLGTASTVAGDATLLSSGSAGVRIAL